MKTWLITGGTSGFGTAYAEAALANGDQVVLTARNVDQLRDWADRHGDCALVLPLDVTDPSGIARIVSSSECSIPAVCGRDGRLSAVTVGDWSIESGC